MSNIKVEVELTPAQVEWLRGAIAPDYAGRSRRLIEAVQAALPPEPIEVTIILDPNTAHQLPVASRFYKKGMFMTALDAAVLNQVCTALDQRRRNR